MKQLFLILALCLVAVPAYAKELPRGTLLCGNQDSIDEGVRAIAMGDSQWLKTLATSTCLFTNQPVRAERLDCSGQTCKIRFWIVSGQSAVGYAMRSSMAGN